ncbi:ArsR family transcriptional regulator [Streptomyces hoynatensis]|uniref:Transcriptional regulator n=1 Tax=Streptomyces hoynatensis TaxID=1141874 RepID=A0A3A9Z6P0_9ACTN|nr:ArsR family transcriptional regulator [Streptomyces hoynatensis]RKN42977.1 transcriptional regulator [Streptomyces hoynatensis]
MGVWVIPADVLARGRFAVSPLSETVAALLALARGETRPGREDWLRAHAPAFRRRLAADPFAAGFVRVALPPRWLPDLLVTPPLPGDRTFHDELRRVRATPPEAALADLAEGLNGPPPARLCVPDLPDRVAGLLDWVWTHTVRPEWPRLRRLFEADIVSRAQALGSGGWAAALDGLRPGMRWLGDGRLRINANPYPPRELSGAQLLFIPTTTPRGWVGWEEPRRYSVIYPATGLLAGPEPAGPPGAALGRLLGPARAAVLGQLGSPLSTTQLVALTGLSLGSVGGHLKVLREARLVHRRRSGRLVLYYRTALGEALATGREAGPAWDAVPGEPGPGDRPRGRAAGDRPRGEAARPGRET